MMEPTAPTEGDSFTASVPTEYDVGGGNYNAAPAAEAQGGFDWKKWAVNPTLWANVAKLGAALSPEGSWQRGLGAYAANAWEGQQMSDAKKKLLGQLVGGGTGAGSSPFALELGDTMGMGPESVSKLYDTAMGEREKERKFGLDVVKTLDSLENSANNREYIASLKDRVAQETKIAGTKDKERLASIENFVGTIKLWKEGKGKPSYIDDSAIEALAALGPEQGMKMLEKIAEENEKEKGKLHYFADDSNLYALKGGVLQNTTPIQKAPKGTDPATKAHYQDRSFNLAVSDHMTEVIADLKKKGIYNEKIKEIQALTGKPDNERAMYYMSMYSLLSPELQTKISGRYNERLGYMSKNHGQILLPGQNAPTEAAAPSVGTSNSEEAGANMPAPKSSSPEGVDSRPQSKSTNPGNIKFTKAFQNIFGATEGKAATDGGVFAVFPDRQTGIRAMNYLLKTPTYSPLTVDAAMKKWSNKGYGGELVPQLSARIMSSLNNQELALLMSAMIKREGA
jgi:hypothetical protein